MQANQLPANGMTSQISANQLPANSMTSQISANQLPANSMTSQISSNQMSSSMMSSSMTKQVSSSSTQQSFQSFGSSKTTVNQVHCLSVHVHTSLHANRSYRCYQKKTVFFLKYSAVFSIYKHPQSHLYPCYILMVCPCYLSPHCVPCYLLMVCPCYPPPPSHGAPLLNHLII